MRTIPVMLCIAVLLSACAIKTKFKDGELKWYNVYKVDDTLIFQSTSGLLDTSVIVKKELYYPEYMPFEVHDSYLPQHCDVWYKNKALKYNPDGDILISMIKRRSKNINAHISYLGNGIGIANIITDLRKHKKEGKVYAFDCFNERARSVVPRMIYWHEDFGIIKYLTHGGVTWTRIGFEK